MVVSTKIDVYPVGILRDLLALRRAFARRDLPDIARIHARQNVRGSISRMAGYVRAGKWHELKCHLNGYLAEPTPFPEGATRCGSGWTKKRALWSLRRQIRRPGVHWDQADREIEAMLR